jgi:hypothetical protein
MEDMTATDSQEPIDVESVEVPRADEAAKEFSVEIVISEKNLKYRSDFSEAETIFWLEAVKDLILKKTFDAANGNIA